MMDIENVNDDGIKNLAAGIIEAAVYEYKLAINRRKVLEEELVNMNREIDSCEAFFKSDWCRQLAPNLEASTIINNSIHTAEEEYSKLTHSCVITFKPKNTIKVN